jgi:hypothetical protein
LDARVKRIYDLREHLIEIPPFQRPYSWDQENWQRLWFEVGLSYFERRTRVAQGTTRPIFIGAIVRQRLDPQRVGEREVEEHYGLIDGQQRLVTLSLLAAAARDRVFKPGSADFSEWNADFLTLRDASTTVLKLTVQKRNQSAYEAALAPKRRDHQPLDSVFPGSPVAQAYDHFFDLFGRDENDLLESLTASGDDRISTDSVDEEVVAEPEEAVASQSSDRERAAPSTGSDGSTLDIRALREVLYSGILFVDVVLEKSEDLSSEIFESLNSTGMELSPVDLFRNGYFLLLPDEKEAIFDIYWRPMEESHVELLPPSKRDEPPETLSRFFFDETIRRFGFTPMDRTYNRLMTDIRSVALQARAMTTTDDRDVSYRTSIHQALGDIRVSDALYRLLISSQERAREHRLPETSQRSLEFLQAWDAAPVRPLLLELLRRRVAPENDQAAISADDLDDALQLVEALLVRRAAAAVPVQQLRSLLSDVPIRLRTELARSASAGPVSERLREIFVGFGAERFPDRTQLSTAWDREVYSIIGKKKQLALLLWEIERNQSDEKGTALGSLKYGRGAKKFSLEHVLPQGIVRPKEPRRGRRQRVELQVGLPVAWEEDLRRWGIEDPFEYYRRYRHVLANLTLALGKDNSAYSSLSFDKKRKAYTERSDLDITRRTITNQEQWGLTALEERAAWLIHEIERRWPI